MLHSICSDPNQPSILNTFKLGEEGVLLEFILNNFQYFSWLKLRTNFMNLISEIASTNLLLRIFHILHTLHKRYIQPT